MNSFSSSPVFRRLIKTYSEEMGLTFSEGCRHLVLVGWNVEHASGAVTRGREVKEFRERHDKDLRAQAIRKREKIPPEKNVVDYDKFTFERVGMEAHRERIEAHQRAREAKLRELEREEGQTASITNDVKPGIGCPKYLWGDDDLKTETEVERFNRIYGGG